MEDWQIIVLGWILQDIDSTLITEAHNREMGGGGGWTRYSEHVYKKKRQMYCSLIF